MTYRFLIATSGAFRNDDVEYPYFVVPETRPTIQIVSRESDASEATEEELMVIMADELEDEVGETR